ncbi:sensor histidine kinase [Oceanirhabdus sp. W0125-5]|uniref:sensor histidine kinase n=1 Tax=Oceanirhabdus sp. W0125-5 TaxID=2999116 RepID=UPI0022F30EED|nr:HAMP domain-containing sensor histidine kinase [Oceanirhabdus sp. W0125-5]WBW99666.1 HAMP domain-containing sensor histidine kinase [Oceanirhabdus sp. W0125-5]
MIYILMVIILVLCLLLYNERYHNIKISKKLKEIIEEESMERLKFENASKDKKKLLNNINILMDKHQEIFMENKKYIEQHRRMISNISHDIRTPLTSLIGYIELSKSEDINLEKRMDYLNIAYSRGIVLKNMIEEFFHMSKLESDDIEIKIEKVNLSEVLRNNIISFISDFEKNHIHPEINITENEVYIQGDVVCLNRIIANLISNSIKYGYEGKMIGIELSEDNEAVVLKIWDKGKGIHKEELPFIFERLYTGEKSRNRKLQGSGLGLAITKNLVEKMSGNITVESTPFERTTFTVTFNKK